MNDWVLAGGGTPYKLGLYFSLIYSYFLYLLEAFMLVWIRGLPHMGGSTKKLEFGVTQCDKSITHGNPKRVYVQKL